MERQALAGLLLALSAWAQTGASDSFEHALELMRGGNLAGAEQLLTGKTDADSLGLLAVVLDQEKQLDRADAAYRAALKLTPHSAALLNNYGNHLIAAGKHVAARAQFVQVIAVDPRHRNAHVQLARIALEQRQPREALRNLDQAGPREGETGDVAILRMQALFSAHRDAEANALLAAIAAGPHDDPGLARALASAGQFEKSRRYYASALREKGDDASLLYEAAAAESSLGSPENALSLLARAAKIAPDRADIQQLLARVAGQLHYAGDAAAAWARYAELAPDDDQGRRERGFSQTAVGGDTQTATADLRWYVNRHPDDPVGHYELGTAIAPSSPDEARAELDRALTLRPDLIPAHVARGILNYRQGSYTAALADFRAAEERDPKNAAVLDRVGETYLALNRPEDALPPLRKAADLASSEPRIQLHLGRALAKAGRADEASHVLARFRQLGADKSTLPPAAGVVDYLNLPPAEQLRLYRAGVEKTVRDHPDNAQALLRYLGILLDQGDIASAETATRQLLALKPPPGLIGEAADTLIEAKQYALAKRLIEEAEDRRGLLLDLAIAVFHLQGANAAWPILSNIPEAERNGDTYLADTLVLFTLHRESEGRAALAKALTRRPARADLYREAADALVAAKAYADARTLLNDALGRFPDDPELLRIEAAALGVPKQ